MNNESSEKFIYTAYGPVQKRFCGRVIPDIEPIDITSAFNIKAQDDLAKFSAVLETLEKLGYKSAVLYGGALRDIYLGGSFRDLDVYATNPKNRERFLPSCRTILDIEGLETDVMEGSDFKAEWIAVCGDAPINSLAMDRSGRILAHPQFQTHAAQQLFEIQPMDYHDTARSVRRFKKLQERYPDMTFKANGFWSRFFVPSLLRDKNPDQNSSYGVSY
jgi:hypothetical protein